MSQHQFSAPQLTKINKIILIAAGACFILFSSLKAVGAFNLVGLLGLSASGLMSGYIFQLFTYPLVEVNLMGFIFNALVVWFIGSELEQQWGSKIYLRFLLINVIGVGVVYATVNVYPDRQMSLMMIFPMRARTFCWILAGIEAYMAIFSNLTSAWAHLLAMGISYLIIRFQTKPLVRMALNANFETKKRSKSHLYVVKDEDQKPPKFWQ
jgi:hypothetical protein